MDTANTRPEGADLTNAEFVEACDTFLADKDATLEDAALIELEAIARGYTLNPWVSFDSNVHSWRNAVKDPCRMTDHECSDCEDSPRGWECSWCGRGCKPGAH